MPRRVGAKPRYVFRSGGCMLSRPRVCWGAEIAKSPVITARPRKRSAQWAATSIVIPAVRAAPNWSFCALRTGQCSGRPRQDDERRRAVRHGAERQLICALPPWPGSLRNASTSAANPVWCWNRKPVRHDRLLSPTDSRVMSVRTPSTGRARICQWSVAEASQRICAEVISSLSADRSR